MINSSTKAPITQNPCYTQPFSEVYNEDCIEVMKRYEDNYFDIAVVDPPYGLDKKLSSGGGKMRNSPFKKLYRDSNQWDKLPETEYWVELFRVSKNQIVFGANYFLDYLPNTRGFICWDKKQDMPTLSACELVWTSFDKPAKIYKKVSTDLNRFHPTQKPIDLYRWILQNYAEEGNLILDTHLGSGSSRIACNELHFAFTGFEIDKDYYEAQEKRFKDFVSQLRMF